MKNSILALALILATINLHAQKMDNTNLEKRIAAIEDKIAIKNAVDVYSNLADTKDFDQQVLLFTRDAVVESFSGSEKVSSLKGRTQIKETFTSFLSNFHTVYHQNGQQTIDELTKNTAKAISYCRVILIGEQNGKQIKTTMYTIYKDKFIKEDGHWLIKHRISNFVHREAEELK